MARVKALLLPAAMLLIIAAQAATIWLVMETRDTVENIEYVAYDAVTAATDAADEARDACRQLNC